MAAPKRARDDVPEGGAGGPPPPPPARRPATRSVIAAEVYAQRLKLTDIIGFVAQSGYAVEADACAGLNRETWRCVPPGLSAADADRVRAGHPLWQAIIDLKHGELSATRLMMAARNWRLDRVRSLCDWRANIEAQNARGWTALHYASRFGSMYCLQELIDRGANVNAPDVDGLTPLMIASFYSDIPLAAVVRALLAAGGDKRLASLAGSTARDFALTVSYNPGGLADPPDPKKLGSQIIALLDAAP